MYRKYLKRILDLFLSGLGLIFLSPIFLLLVIMGMLFLRGNPFYMQYRPGKNEKVFMLVKFRTMTNEEDEFGNLLPDKQRLGTYGKFLRKTSLDELPELLNIFKGEMSIVGPRPLTVSYLKYYNEKEKLRHNVMPGLTGLAQINGRTTLNWEKRFEYDVQYVDNISFFLDLKIILYTIKKVVQQSDVVEAEEQGDFGDYREKQWNEGAETVAKRNRKRFLE